ncbi:hypothetical protein ACFQX6_38205 [Streptosporangium lutulentum]
MAAFVGSGIAYLLDFEDNTWGVLILQLLLAVVCVGVVASRKKDEQSEV